MGVSSLRRVLVGALAAAAAAAALAGSASAAAARPTACTLVSRAQYRAVLGKPVRLIAGEGATSCNVVVGGSFRNTIIPNLNPYNGAYIKRMLSSLRKEGAVLTRVPSLGPVGYVVVMTDGTVTSYAEKHGWFIAFQGLGTSMNKPQAIRLAAIALTRV